MATNYDILLVYDFHSGYCCLHILLVFFIFVCMCVRVCACVCVCVCAAAADIESVLWSYNHQNEIAG